MKRITHTMWAAVAVLGLYCPVFTYAGPFGNYGLRGMGSGGGSSQSSSTPTTRSLPGGGTFGSLKTQVGPMQKSGGFSSQVLKNPTQSSPPTLGKRKLENVKTGPLVDISKSLGNATKNVDPNAGRTLGKRKLPGGIDILPTGGAKDPNAGNTLGKRKLPGNIDLSKIGVGPKPTKPPKLDLPIDKFPGKIDPGKIPPIDPGKGNGGGMKPPFDPFPGGKWPPLDPGNGGGNNPPGGGNNPPGGGNGGGGNGGGFPDDHCHHGGGKFCWPNWGLGWCWPAYYTQPYCGTVFINGGWQYVTQPVAVEQISLVQLTDTLPEIPSNATFKMQVAGLGAAKGIAAVEVNGVGMPAELLEWNGDSVVIRLPAVGLSQPAISNLYVLQADGSMVKDLKFKMLPALSTAVASN
jgi:hypothetical protein